MLYSCDNYSRYVIRNISYNNLILETSREQIKNCVLIQERHVTRDLTIEVPQGSEVVLFDVIGSLNRDHFIADYIVVSIDTIFYEDLEKSQLLNY